MNQWNDFKSWRDIYKWASDKGFDELCKRMVLNHECWNSSGEFGRSQVAICDSIRFAETEEDAIKCAEQMNLQMAVNYGLWGDDE